MDTLVTIHEAPQARPMANPALVRSEAARLRALIAEALGYVRQIEVDLDLDCPDLARGYIALARQTAREAAAVATHLEEVAR